MRQQLERLSVNEVPDKGIFQIQVNLTETPACAQKKIKDHLKESKSKIVWGQEQ